MIYHIATHTDWDKAQREGIYSPNSLESEGFIHCSFQEQVLGSALKHFHGVSDLVVFCISTQKLQGEIRVEAGEGSTQKFPHIYAPITLDAILEVIPFDPQHPGEFR